MTQIFSVMFKEEDGTEKRVSVCVGTQGWVSHKMLPLAGKRGMVWCGIGVAWQRCGVVHGEAWCVT